MQNKRGKRFILSVAVMQIVLIVMMSFAFTFILSAELVQSVEDPKINVGRPPIKEQTVKVDFVSKDGTKVTSTPTATKSAQYVNMPKGAYDYNVQFSDGSTLSRADIKMINPPGADGTGGSIVTSQGTTRPISPEEYKSFQSQVNAQGGALQGQKQYTVLGQSLYGGWAHLAQGVMWAVFAAGAIQLIGNLAGLEKGTTNSLTIAAVGGIMAGKTVAAFGPGGFSSTQGSTFWSQGFGKFLSSGWGQFTVGLAVAAAIFILTYSKEKKQMVRFECLPWEPPLGGAACEECNKDPFRPCSEYRCKSLGQACQLLNAGTGREQCAWVSKNDVSSPTITPWNEPLQPKEAKYVPDTSVRPPALGSKIIMGGSGCLPAFTALQFGFITNEPAQCKVDYNHTQKFDDMQFYVGGDNYYRYNHTQSMRLPGPDSADSSIRPLLNNDGSFSLYTRCRDANGNENVDEYSFSFCVEQGPDTTPPRIEKTSITSGSPVQYNVDQVPIEIYTNEPAECKWSTQSKPFADMENTLRCATATYQVNADLLYTCAGNLTGIKNKEENIFYFRCKDQPGKAENERNVMVQSHELKLLGSQQLTIDSVKPNGTISGSTSTVKTLLEIETSNGAEEGKSVCSFSPTGTLNSYVTMFETNNYLHKQELNLVNGTYTYYFRCVDAGGNAASANTTFSIAIDKSAPQVTRVYRDQALKVVTDEDAECRYSLTTCNFNIADGIRMEYMNIESKNKHFADWKPGFTYYIKCSDAYGNEPGPAECNLIARPTSFEKEL